MTCVSMSAPPQCCDDPQDLYEHIKVNGYCLKHLLRTSLELLCFFQECAQGHSLISIGSICQLMIVQQLLDAAGVQWHILCRSSQLRCTFTFTYLATERKKLTLVLEILMEPVHFTCELESDLQHSMPAVLSHAKMTAHPVPSSIFGC